MKSTRVIVCGVLLAFAMFVGGATSLAQVDPETPTPTDPEAPAGECVQPADAPVPDQVMDGDPVPICTPSPVSDVALTDPTLASTPLPADMPAPTDTPRPTDTPQPVVPSDTPTPPPPAVTDTPTPTSAARDVPVGTLARQLPFANPGDDNDCVFDLTVVSDTAQSCAPSTFPALVTIDITPYSSGADRTVQVNGRQAQKINSERFDFLSVPGGLGPDTHKITASETFGGTALSAKLTVPVRKANSPRLLVYPRHLAPGAGGKIYLAGFPPDTIVPLGVYREQPDCTAYGKGKECFQLLRELGTVRTDGGGNAVREFSVAANETPTAYLVSTPGLKINPQDVANSLRALGRPWYVVDQH